MKRTYKLICIRRNKKYDNDIMTYTITPIQRGLQAIQTFIDNNELQVLFRVKETYAEEAIFIFQGKKKDIEFSLHSLLCNSNLADYFKVEEWF